jgi:hypothetical protein
MKSPAFLTGFSTSISLFSSLAKTIRIFPEGKKPPWGWGGWGLLCGSDGIFHPPPVTALRAD